MEKLCPLLKKPCIEHGCRWWTNVQGRHPQSGEVVNQWACAVELLPILQITVAQEVRQGAAATESLRNENVAIGEALAKAVVFKALTNREEKDAGTDLKLAG